jgi:hypothetical protein
LFAPERIDQRVDERVEPAAEIGLQLAPHNRCKARRLGRAQAADLKGTQTHLHHVINCLVGPQGQGFDDKEANPCTDEARKTALIQALAKANEGLRQTDLAAAHKSASEAHVLLTPKM